MRLSSPRVELHPRTTGAQGRATGRAQHEPGARSGRTRRTRNAKPSDDHSTRPDLRVTAGDRIYLLARGPCVTNTSRTRYPGVTHSTGPDSAITSLSHILPVAILWALGGYQRILMNGRGSAGDGETPADRMSRCSRSRSRSVRSAVGVRVPWLSCKNTQYRAVQPEALNARSLFLACGTYDLSTIPSKDHRNEVYATTVGLFLSVVFATGFRAWGREVDAQRANGCFVFTTREVWSVMP